VNFVKRIVVPPGKAVIVVTTGYALAIAGQGAASGTLTEVVASVDRAGRTILTDRSGRACRRLARQRRALRQAWHGGLISQAGPPRKQATGDSGCDPAAKVQSRRQPHQRAAVHFGH